MGNVCAWRQGKGKLEEEKETHNNGKSTVSDFKLIKGNSSRDNKTKLQENGIYAYTNKKNGNTENNDNVKENIIEPFHLDKGETENDSKESKTTNENTGENKETHISNQGVILTTEDVSSAGESSDSHMSDEDKENAERIEKDLLEAASIKKKRLSVSAEAYGEWNKKKENFVPKVYEKDEKEKKKIREALNDSFLFNHLNEQDIETLVNAFFMVKVEKGHHIITEGDDGDLLYVIDEGEVEIYKMIEVGGSENAENAENAVNGAEKKKDVLTVLKSKDVFGELALLYNSKRAATAEALTDCSLWALGRETFNYIIKDTVSKNRQMYEEILQNVYVLKDMDPYERSKLADCLKSKSFKHGDVIINEGEEGDTFYMLVEGHAVAKKNGTVIKTYSKGDHFGELALLKNQPRAASVMCEGSCQVVYLDRKSFKRLLGPVEFILNRNVENYKQVLKQLGLDTTCIEATT